MSQLANILRPTGEQRTPGLCCLISAIEASEHFEKSKKNPGGGMSRDLRPAKRRVCRKVFACLFVMIFSFLLVNAIESLIDRSPPGRKVIVQPEPGNSIVRDLERPRPLSAGSDDSGAQPQKKSSPGAEPDDAERVSPSIMKARLERRGTMAPERVVRFDSQPFERLADAQSGFAEIRPQPILTDTFQANPKKGIATASASPELSLPTPPQEPRISEQEDSPAPGKVEEPSATAESLTEEQVLHIKSRLRDLGFLSSAKRGVWDASARNALRDFKVVNGLSNDDAWDLETSNRINSPVAVRADQSIIGNWSEAPCRSVKPTDTRLSVSSRQAKSSAGSICEFHDLKVTAREWRVKATCSQGDERWTANGKFSLSADKLVWTSEGDVSSYFRCNLGAVH